MNMEEISADDNKDVVTKAEDTENEREKIQQALYAVAEEMQRFHCSTLSNNEPNCLRTKSDIGEEISVLQNNMRRKESVIRNLKSNIKSAVDVAISVLENKAVEANLTNDKLINARGEFIVMSSLNQSRDEILHQISMENKTLRNQIENLEKIVQLAYEQLLKINQEDYIDLTPPLQLKKIIASCGQFYADYHNEHNKLTQIEHKNVFLSNKLNVLQKNLNDSVAETTRLRREICTLTNKKAQKYRKGNCSSEKYDQIGDSLSDTITQTCLNKCPSRKTSEVSSCSDLDLKPHMALIRSLLRDQKEMMGNLKMISKELNPSI